MRPLTVAIAVSTALHASAIAWVHTHPPPTPEPPREVTATPIQIVPPPAEPMVVALLDDNTVAAAAPGPSPVAAGHAGGHSQIATMTGASRGGEATAATTTPKNRWMTMRYPTIKSTGLSPEFWAKFDANSPPIIDQSAAGIAGRLANPGWIANASPEELDAERARLVAAREQAAHAELKPDGAGTKTEHDRFRMRFNGDGTVASIEDKPNWQQKSLFYAEFDVTEMMMRRHGIDPYSSSKLKILDDTREQRYETGKIYRSEQLARSRELMQKNIERAVATVRDPVALREALFELWDDCAEKGSDELVAGGRLAREQLLGYVRSRFARDSANGYPADELARLNKQRKSQAIFARTNEATTFGATQCAWVVSTGH